MKQFSRRLVNRYGALHYFCSFFLYFMVLLVCKCLENSKIIASKDILTRTKMFGKNGFAQAGSSELMFGYSGYF